MNSQSFPVRQDGLEGEVVIEVRRGDEELLLDVELRREDGHEVIMIDVIDIEECGRGNRKPPPAHRYKVKIDCDYFVFDHRHVTGRQLLDRAGKVPAERYEIEKRMHGGHYVPVGLEEKVDLGEHGIEVFETFPLDETEG
jgi:Multiubiquitin